MYRESIFPTGPCSGYFKPYLFEQLAVFLSSCQLKSGLALLNYCTLMYFVDTLLFAFTPSWYSHQHVYTHVCTVLVVSKDNTSMLPCTSHVDFNTCIVMRFAEVGVNYQVVD